MAARLNYLFATIRRADDARYSVDEAVRWINAHRSSTTRERVAALLDPSSDSPRACDLAALAEFFCVPLTFFTDTEQAPVDGSHQNGLIQQRLDSYRSGTISQRIYYLFTTVPNGAGRPYPATEVARWINDNGGKITSVYIKKLTTGERGKNPSSEILYWIGRFFAVGEEFFLRDHPEPIDSAHQSAIVLLREERAIELIHFYNQLTHGQRQSVYQLVAGLASDNDCRP